MLYHQPPPTQRYNYDIIILVSDNIDNNIFPKIWKVIKFGYTIIATINVQIQTKDCVDSNVLLIRL